MDISTVFIVHRSLELVIIALALHRLANMNILFTTVPSGQIVVAMMSEKAHRYLANIEGRWVHPKTGKVYENSDKTVRKPSMPINIFGLGIYWLGFWPFATRYTYAFPRNKYTKKENGIDYDLIPIDDEVDSLFFEASYGIRIRGAETKEKLPITMDLLFTMQTTDAYVALFKNISPNWLARATGEIEGGLRDYIGNNSIDDINELDAEIGKEASGKSGFQQRIMLLNTSKFGNPGLDELVGQIIIAVSFLSWSIDEMGANEAQKATITKWRAEREAEKTAVDADAKAKALVTEATGKADAAAQDARGIREIADARAYEIQVEGEAKAGATKQMTEALKGNEHAGTMSLAEALSNTKATTVVLGGGVVPTLELKKGEKENG